MREEEIRVNRVLQARERLKNSLDLTRTIIYSILSTRNSCLSSYLAFLGVDKNNRDGCHSN